MNPHELAKDTTLCIGCARRFPSQTAKTVGLWCRDCWHTGLETGTMPDLLDGGKALRRRPA